MLEAAAVVLAGGKSTRMGEDKALLNVTGRRMLEGTVRLLSAVFTEIFISANDNSYDDLNIKVIPDDFKGSGPLGGIHAALKYSTHHTNFFTACDMPFIDIRLAVYLIDQVEGYDAVVPRMGNYYQPLFAVYTKECLQAVENRIQAGKNKITSFYDDIKIKFVDTDELRKFGNPDELFFNVNTPGDLELAKSIAGRKHDGTAE